jgi:hypothetical protein
MVRRESDLAKKDGPKTAPTVVKERLINGFGCAEMTV